MMSPSREPMARRQFYPGDQDAFARLSGDYNPLHLDSLAARRLIFGGPVVHGVHALLWALDAVTGPAAAVARLKAEFVAPIPVGAEVALDAGTPAPGTHRLRVTTDDGGTAAVIDVAWAAATNAGRLPKSGCPDAGTPHLVSSEDAAGQSGRVDLHLDRDLASSLFHNLAKTLDAAQLAAVLATSRVVGMECPGEHSIFSGMALEAAPNTAGEPVLDYRVARVKPRLSLADIEISGGGLAGRIRALFRPPPTTQPPFTELATLVNDGEFAGRRALIIGGSRGLGEVAAKLLTAGDADVRLTYHSGWSDAERVRDEIAAGGGRAECFAFDVLTPPRNLAERLGDGWRPTMLGYFATPHIGVGKSDGFSDTIHQRLSHTYVNGFRATVAAVRAVGAGELRILYPSSVYVDDAPPDMKEYAAAKEAGERACAELAIEAGFKFVAPRFPRLATDQTARLLGEKEADAGAAVLDALRRLFDNTKDPQAEKP